MVKKEAEKHLIKNLMNLQAYSKSQWWDGWYRLPKWYYLKNSFLFYILWVMSWRKLDNNIENWRFFWKKTEDLANKIKLSRQSVSNYIKSKDQKVIYLPEWLYNFRKLYEYLWPDKVKLEK